jgi:hypothetical protein
MMIQFPRIFLALILCGVFVKPASAQQIEHAVGAPFTATFSITTPGQPRYVCQMARASDGSIYRGCSGANGRLSRVEISDVPNNRVIAFFVPPPDVPNHTYTLLPPPQHGKYTIKSADDVREELRRGQGFCSCREEPSTSLGERSSDGLTLFGFRTEKTYSDGRKRVTEYWESDLGIVVSSKSVGPQEGEEHSYVITNIRREEPDPSLFQIPKEYISDPLLEAKTVYIENLTGTPEVVDGVLGDLYFWKRPPLGSHVKPLTVVNDKNAADLTATFTRVPVVEGSNVDGSNKEGSGKPGIRMEVFPRDSSDPAYRVTLVLERDSVDGHKLIAMQCFNALRNRLETTRVGLQPQPGSAGLKAQAAE